jgi:mannitol/fructose-specific phosphotransferase system IIA component (Ntr-type)
MPNILENPVIISGESSRDDVLLTLFDAFEKEQAINPAAIESMKTAAIEREHTSSTFLGRGLALPHGRTDALDEIRIAVGVSDTGIPWDDDGNRARLVLLLGVPAAMIRDYLLLMQKILRWHKDTKTIDSEGRVTNASELLSELKNLIA